MAKLARLFLVALCLLTAFPALAVPLPPPLSPASTNPTKAGEFDLQFNDKLSCNAGLANGSLFYDRGLPTETGYGACSPDEANIFQRIFCIFEGTLGAVISTIFCSLQQEYVRAFGATLILFMTIFGAMVMTGMLNVTIKEMVTTLLKISLIVAFAFNLDIILNISYGFFLGVVHYTVGLFNQYSGHEAATGMYKTDNMVRGLRDYLATTQNPDRPAVNLPNCGLGFIGLLIVLLLTAPFIFAIMIHSLIAQMALYARIAFAYFYGLTIITFMIALSPIFVSFALFKITSEIFENWLNYMISHVIQIFVVFAFIFLASKVELIHWLLSLQTVVRPWWLEIPLGSFSIKFPPFNLGCTICQDVIIPPMSNFTEALSCPSSNATDKGMNPWEIFSYQNGQLVSYLVINAIAILVLTRCIEQMVHVLPELAHKLAGDTFAPQLAGVSTPGHVNPDALPAPGLSALAEVPEGFEDGYMHSRGSVLKRTRAGLGELGSTLLYGRETDPERQPNIRNRNHFARMASAAHDKRVADQGEYDEAESHLEKLTQLFHHGHANEALVGAARLRFNRAALNLRRSGAAENLAVKRANTRGNRVGGLFDEIYNPNGENEEYLGRQNQPGVGNAWHSLLNLNQDG